MPPTTGHHAYYNVTKSVRDPGTPNWRWKSLASVRRRSTPTRRSCRAPLLVAIEPSSEHDGQDLKDGKREAREGGALTTTANQII